MKVTPRLISSMPTSRREKRSPVSVRLIRERRDYYWNWSDSEGWQSQFDQDLQEGEESLTCRPARSAK